jgi:hypothetical protein
MGSYGLDQVQLTDNFIWFYSRARNKHAYLREPVINGNKQNFPSCAESTDE